MPVVKEDAWPEEVDDDATVSLCKLKQLPELIKLTERAWGIIANAYGGDWDLASEASGWKAAAERWRDAYLKTLPSASAEGEKPPNPSS